MINKNVLKTLNCTLKVKDINFITITTTNANTKETTAQTLAPLKNITTSPGRFGDNKSPPIIFISKFLKKHTKYITYKTACNDLFSLNGFIIT